MKKLIPPFRVGRKQGRAVLDANGILVVMFEDGMEDYASEYCDMLNAKYPQQDLSLTTKLNQMKPFDLEAAKAGKKVVTRDGKPVEILKWDMDGVYPIVACVNNSDVYTFGENGSELFGIESEDDLFMAAETVELWVNVYYSISGYYFPSHYLCNTKEEATAQISGKNCIATVKITFEV
jgi:hypothetical protein